MSSPYDPAPPPPRPAPPPPRGSALGVAFTLSILLNLFLIVGGGLVLLAVLVVAAAGGGDVQIQEKLHSGKSSAKDKIAVIRIEGLIMEDLLGFVHKEIETAGQDKHIKAVVVRVDSPGGTITASDDLYKRLVELRDGNAEKKIDAKKHLVVSMGSMAASGGYYVSMPAKTLVAERTSITGSIGVYAALPNVAELANKYGVKMNIIKRGEVKASGSMFKEMTDEERQVWQDMVDNAYQQFLTVVEEGRPDLKGKLREKVIDEKRKVHDDETDKDRTFQYVRRRADGGIFTADEALKFGLIDKVGYLEDAVAEAKQAAGLGDDYKVITYERPFSLEELLTGAESGQQKALVLDPRRLSSGATPRLWYLAPGAELAGVLSAAGR
jgi:protease IV